MKQTRICEFFPSVHNSCDRLRHDLIKNNFRNGSLEKYTVERESFRKSGILNRFGCTCTCYNQIFNSPLVQSIRENHANIEKISDYEWQDMENQDPEDVF
jgi:hypothetical protein